MHETRSLRPEDRAAFVEIGNRDRPTHRHQTVEGWAYWDEQKPEGQVDLRLVVPDPETDQPLALLSMADLNTTSWKMQDVCEMEILVDHAHRRQGIGAMLYDHALGWARERGAKRLVTAFRESTPDEPAITFLGKRGFAEQEREKPSYLDLKTWDPAPFQAAATRAEAGGARLLSYAEVADTEENRRKLYDLFCPVIYDIPRRDDQPFQIEDFAHWAKTQFEHPKWRPELLQLAQVEGEWVGMTLVMPRFQDDGAMQWITGVLKEHRGKGIATALKVRSYQTTQRLGFSVITTENHEDNGPMLAVNKKFGFIPEPHIVFYNKVL